MRTRSGDNERGWCKKYSKIDVRFVEYWQEKYDSKWHDEEEYRKLIKIIKTEVKNKKGISKKTFGRIYKWKAARAFHYVKIDEYNKYEEYLRKAIWENNYMKKVEMLDELQGIGVPMASTILHFIYPKQFPIVDKRLVDTLQYFKKLERNKLYHYRDTPKGYMEFRDVMLKLKNELRKSLRKIDRALFAYHKICLQKNI